MVPGQLWVPSSPCSLKEAEELFGRSGLSDPGEHVADAVLVRGKGRVGHGVDGESDMEPVLVRVPGGRFDAAAGCDADDNELRDFELSEAFRARCRRRRCARIS